MKSNFRNKIILFILSFTTIFSQAQITNTYDYPTTWTVPSGVTSITIKVYGGAGGTGGQDCGAGCSNAASGETGYVYATFNVSPGDIIGIYPGEKGADGSDNESGTGGGSGGLSSYSFDYNGGNGGNPGWSGSSGGGGGGGAASIVTINSVIKIVAGGAGGGGGMANLEDSGYPGNSSTFSNFSNTGGDGTTPFGDGGGGGGGGGGEFASYGGDVHDADGESGGDGGYRGDNFITGESSISNNESIAWTNTGQIEITFASFTLPVTWQSFTAAKENNGIRLNWSTAAEYNAKDFLVQHSTNGNDWNIIAVTAATNTNRLHQYSFFDQQATAGLNYYRLLQRDIDNKSSYSKIILLNLEAENKLKIYPNPAVNKTITISLNKASTLQVYNMLGVKLMEKEFSAGEHRITLSQLTKGSYYLRTKDNSVQLIIPQ